MRNTIILFIFVVLNSTVYTQTVSFNYLNQIPPNDSAIVFAPGIVSSQEGFVSSITFSKDNKFCCFVVYDGRAWSYSDIQYAVFDEGAWSGFKVADFIKSSDFFDISPSFAPDGTKLFFSSARPSKPYNQVDLWIMERNKMEWGVPTKLDTAINSYMDESKCSCSNDRTLYFGKDQTGKIWSADFIDGKYCVPTEVKFPGLDEKQLIFQPFISPDEEFILFTSCIKENCKNDRDIFISFRLKDSIWSRPINLGRKVNTSAIEQGPTLSPDNMYLFFERGELRKSNAIYWISFNQLYDSLKLQVSEAVQNEF